MNAHVLLWVGIDLGGEAHQACVLDTERNVLLERKLAHDGATLRAFVDELIKLAEGDVSRLAVAVETPRGSVVHAMMERGIRVFAINPKQLDRFRDRHSAAGSKDDRKDAFVLADSLRTDLPSFRAVDLGDACILQLRELVRAHDELVAERTALGSRFREQLHRYYPQILALGNVYNDAWLWTLWERAPTPQQGKRLALSKLESILKSHRIRRLSPEDVRAALSVEPLGAAPGVVEAAVGQIRRLLRRLRLVSEQQKEVSRELDKLLDSYCESPEQRREHRDAKILRSLPGMGNLSSATMLAEACQPLGERDYRTLRAIAGTAPLTKQSGKRCEVLMRYACKQRLRRALHHATLTFIIKDPRARDQYSRLRSNGHSHGRAIRGVADRMLALLVAMLRASQTYDPDRRTLAA